MQGLDQDITGNWGEDSVPPGTLLPAELETGMRIDIGNMDEFVNVTVKSVEEVSIWGDTMYVIMVDELDFPIIIGSGVHVPLAQDD